MQAIILAAGMGRRLKELTQNNTKCMVEVNGVTLIDRMLHQIQRQNVSRVIIVAGYEREKLKDYIATLGITTPIIYIDNPIYDKTNNIYSLSLASDYLCQDDTLLFESDLIFEDSVLDVLVKDPRPTLALVDKYESWMDGTCVKIDENDNIVGTTMECYTNDDIQVKMQLMNPMLHPTVFMKSRVIKHFMYNEQYRTCQDFELWNRMGRQCKFANLSRETIFYRINIYGATRKAKNNIEVRISMLYDILKGYRRGKFLSLNDDEMKALIGLSLQHHMLNNDKDVLNIYSKVSESQLDCILAPSIFRFNWLLLLKKDIYLFFVGILFWLILGTKVLFCKYINYKAKYRLKKAVISTF